MAIRSTAWLFAMAALFLAGTSAEAQNPKVKAVLKVANKGGQIGDLAFSPDGKSLAVTTAGREVFGLQLWDLQTEKPTLFPQARIFFSLSFRPDSKLLAGISLSTGSTGSSDRGGAAYIVDPATGDKQDFGAGRTYAVAFSPDGKTLASAEFGARPNTLATVTFWDVKTRKERAQIPFGKANLTCLAFSPNGKTLALVREGKIDLIATGTAKVTKTLSAGRECVAFSPDGKTLAAGGVDIKLYDVATGKEQATFTGTGANRLVYSPDGKTLAVANGGLVLWDVEAGKVKFEVRLLRDAHKDVPNEAVTRIVAFSPDGKTIATSCNDDAPQKAAVVLWDVPPAN